jgi:hypothetical protein
MQIDKEIRNNNNLLVLIGVFNFLEQIHTSFVPFCLPFSKNIMHFYKSN